MRQSSTSCCAILCCALLYSGILSGQFTNDPIVIHTDMPSELLHVVDLDGDGDMDILNPTSTQMRWLVNDGSGNFSDPVALAASDNIQQLATGDVDGDGDIDIVFQSLQSGISHLFWQRNLGGATFSAPVLLDEQNDYVLGIKLIDLTGDGHLDLLTHGVFNTGKYLYVNPGDGTFPENYASKIQLASSSYDAFNTGDFNQDGFPDIVRGGIDFGFAEVQYNNGTGDFANSVTLSNSIYPGNSYTFDANGDGWPDPVLDDDWFPNNGGTSFGERTSLYASGVQGGFPVDHADFDGDGLDDLVSYLNYSSSEGLWYHHNEGEGNFTSTHLVPNHAYSVTIRDAYHDVIGDFDGDGAPDIVAIRSDNTIIWFRNALGPTTALIRCFWDANENGIYDAGESTVNNYPVTFTTQHTTYYTDENGTVARFWTPGDYELAIADEGCWAVDDNYQTYTFTWTGEQTEPLDIPFTLLPGNATSPAASLVSGITRCDRIVPFELTLNNTSCVATGGAVALVLDEQVSLAPGSPAPDLVDGNVLWWSFADLPPTYAFDPQIDLLMPSGESTGDVLSFQWYVYGSDCNVAEPITNAPSSALSTGLTACTSGAYTPVLRCSYDPNDKQVHPLRDYLENYTLFEEELTYTIRFQNTGNDTAFTVAILDTLDADLDWSTFRTLGASHAMETKLDANTGEVTFLFDNILLPDSTTNELESQGFVQYALRAKDELLDNTVITNRAAIYFDANLPIITNTVRSTMVEMLVNTAMPNSLQRFQLFPNPTADRTLIVADFTESVPVRLTLLNTTGHSLWTMEQPSITSLRVPIELAGCAAGLYLLRVEVGEAVFTQRLVRLK
ncbi:MAG: T9SS type A sorting domain-containing protein [Bacteroidota bacterium]